MDKYQNNNNVILLNQYMWNLVLIRELLMIIKIYFLVELIIWVK